jgi:hypothetical protein
MSRKLPGIVLASVLRFTRANSSSSRSSGSSSGAVTDGRPERERVAELARERRLEPGPLAQQDLVALGRQRAAVPKPPQHAPVEPLGTGRVDQVAMDPPRLVSDEAAVRVEQRARLLDRAEGPPLDDRAGADERVERPPERAGDGQLGGGDEVTLGDDEPQRPSGRLGGRRRAPE